MIEDELRRRSVRDVEQNKRIANGEAAKPRRDGGRRGSDYCSDRAVAVSGVTVMVD